MKLRAQGQAPKNPAAPASAKQRFLLWQLTGQRWNDASLAKPILMGPASEIIGELLKERERKLDLPGIDKLRAKIRDYLPEFQMSEMPADVPQIDSENAEDDTEHVEATEGEETDPIKKKLAEIEEILRERTKSSAPSVPSPTSDEYIRPAIWDEFILLLRAKQQVLLVGPAGCGKSRLAEEAAKALEMEFFTASFGGGVRASHLYFSTSLKDNTTTTELRPFLHAVQRPGLVLTDEIFGADPDVSLGLNSLCEPSSRSMQTPLGLIKRHNDCLIVAAANTTGRNLDRQYTGAQRADDSLIDRFALCLRLDYDASVETALVERSACKQKDKEFILKRLTDLRLAVRTSNIPFDPSTRRLIACLRACEAGLSAERAFEVAFLAVLSQAERAKVNM